MQYTLWAFSHFHNYYFHKRHRALLQGNVSDGHLKWLLNHMGEQASFRNNCVKLLFTFCQSICTLIHKLMAIHHKAVLLFNIHACILMGYFSNNATDNNMTPYYFVLKMMIGNLSQACMFRLAAPHLYLSCFSTLDTHTHTHLHSHIHTLIYPSVCR